MLMYSVPDIIRHLFSVKDSYINQWDSASYLTVVDEVNILSEDNGSGAHFVLCLETSRAVD